MSTEPQRCWSGIADADCAMGPRVRGRLFRVGCVLWREAMELLFLHLQQMDFQQLVKRGLLEVLAFDNFSYIRNVCSSFWLWNF